MDIYGRVLTIVGGSVLIFNFYEVEDKEQFGKREQYIFPFCETDHGDILYIDININQIKV